MALPPKVDLSAEGLIDARHLGRLELLAVLQPTEQAVQVTVLPDHIKECRYPQQQGYLADD
jgi:hypothetical protein